MSETPHTETPHTETPQTILVIDDHQDNRDLIRRRLERSGYRVLEAADGQAGIDILRREDVDLVILDVMMPGMSGIEVLGIVRRTFTPARLPIIMATAKDQSEDVIEALHHGANDYVTKPLDFPVILARIEAQLRARAQAPTAEETEEALPRTLGPGTVLAGKYQLEEKLGAGNFGTVFRATHLGLHQPVAVKVLQTHLDPSPETLARFQLEGRSAFRMRHPNAVSVLDLKVTEAGLAYLVMELLEGRSLDAELEKHMRLTAERCGQILLPVCEVLAEAHAMGILHRDIKPANIFLHHTRRSEVVKVLDFGIAKLMDDAAMGKSLTLDNGILGTPAYIAPERLSGEDYDGRSDVYSLGVVLYELLTGRAPFRSQNNEAMAIAIMHLTTTPEPLRTLCPQISRSLEDVTLGALVKDPADRPTAVDFSKQLEAALAHEAQQARRLFVRPETDVGIVISPGPEAETRTMRVDRPPQPPPAPGFDFSHLMETAPETGAATLDACPLLPPKDLREPWS